MRITGSNVTIMVQSMDRSIEFYQNLGLELQQRWGDHYAMMTAEGITLGIHPASSPDTGSGTLSIGFMIPSCQEGKQLLDQHGVTYKEENDGKSGRYLHFKDPDSTHIYFVQPQW